MTTVQYVMGYEVATDNCQRHITQFHEKLYIRLVQGNHYTVDLDGFDYFVNDYVLNHFEGKEEPNTGP